MKSGGLGKASHFYNSLEGKKEKQKSNLSRLSTTLKRELVTPDMLCFLYTKDHQLYRHHHKKLFQKSETENGMKVTLPDLLNEI